MPFLQCRHPLPEGMRLQSLQEDDGLPHNRPVRGGEEFIGLRKQYIQAVLPEAVVQFTS